MRARHTSGFGFASKVMWDCYIALKTLAQNHQLTCYGPPGYKRITGNEEVDRWVKAGAKCSFIGPEPVCEPYYTMALGYVSQWSLKEHQKAH